MTAPLAGSILHRCNDGSVTRRAHWDAALERVVKAAEASGWSVKSTAGEGHVRLYAPDGKRMVFASTQRGDDRAVRQLRAALRRAGLSSAPTDHSEETPGDAEEEEPARAALADFTVVSDRLLRAVVEAPELLLELHWREFEELVAGLLHRDGFDVELTPPSGDRGADIYARRREPLGPVLYVVECKRFARERRVGPELVRGLYGVVERERATRGILATTSIFTPGARLEASGDLAYRLTLRDAADMRDWIRAARGGTA